MKADSSGWATYTCTFVHGLDVIKCYFITLCLFCTIVLYFTNQ